MADQTTFTPTGLAQSVETSVAPTVAEALDALRRLERRPAYEPAPSVRPCMSNVEHVKALYIAKQGKTRL